MLIWPSVKVRLTPLVYHNPKGYEEVWWQRTTLKYTVNGCDLTAPKRTQTAEKKCNDSTASDRRPSTPYSSNIPTVFTRNPAICFLKVDKTCVDAFGLFLKVCWRAKIQLGAVRPGWKPHLVTCSFGWSISYVTVTFVDANSEHKVYFYRLCCTFPSITRWLPIAAWCDVTCCIFFQGTWPTLF